MNHNKLLLFKSIEEKRSRLTYLVVIASFMLLFCFSFISAFNFASSAVSVTTFTGNLTNLSQLQDVNIPAPTDAYVLTFDSASGKWIDSLPSAGAELDPKWSANYSLFNTSWSSTYNATYNAYNSTGLIRNWNDTGLIINWNSTGYLVNWSGNYYLNTNPYSFWNNTYATFNKTYADTLYYGKSNPYGFYNTTTIPNYLLASNWNSTNTSYALASNWNATNTSYYLMSNPYSYYNSTTIGNLPNTNNYWNNTFATFNKTYGDTLYLGINNWNSTNTSYALASNWNATNTSYYLATNPYTFWNSSYALFNKTYADTLYDPLGGSELDPKWSANYSLFNNSWSLMTNTSYALASNWNATNSSYYLISNPYGFYNTTTIPNYLLASNWNSTNTSYMLVSNWNATNTSYALASNWNATNTSYLVKAGDTMTGNLNMSTNNITMTNSSNGGARICFNQACTSYMRNNGTGVIIVGG